MSEYKFVKSPDFQQMEPVISPYAPVNYNDNKPPVPTEPQKCKFCEYEWPGGEDHACELSSGEDEDGFWVSYCGNQECPMCYFCQGNEATPDMIRSAKEGRRIREESSNDPLRTVRPPQESAGGR